MPHSAIDTNMQIENELEIYNQEIEDAMIEIDNGNFFSQEEAKKLHQNGN